MIKDGCSFGRESRQMIIDIKENINDVKNSLKEIKDQNIELFNHQSNKIPYGLTMLISLLSSIVVGLSVYFLTH
jgi:hypothetical protein